MKIIITNTTHVLLKNLIPLLPIPMQARAVAYRNSQAAINYCMGRLMLKKAALKMGFEEAILENIEYTARKKPFLKEFYFNISHSGEYVALAYSEHVKMGLDIECPQNVHLPHFRASFREDEWEDIINNKDAKARFYWYWVRKEAILKAVDLPLSELKKIRILSDTLGDTGEGSEKWVLHSIHIEKNCIGILACSQLIEEITINFW
jgi:4'-phosphopantetheinyl transferase